MPPQAPPEYVVRSRRAGDRPLRRVLLLLALLVVLALSFALGWSLAPRRSAAAPAASAEMQALKQRLAILERDRQVMRVASAALQRTLAERGAEVETLRGDLAFYTRLLEGRANAPPGLSVAALRLRPLAGAQGGYTFVITLLQTARTAVAEVHGTLSLRVSGMQAGRPAQLDWAQLAGSAQRDGLPFSFKYFQQLHGMLALPSGFVPARIEITLKPAGGNAITHGEAWAAALAGKEPAHVPQAR